MEVEARSMARRRMGCILGGRLVGGFGSMKGFFLFYVLEEGQE